MNLFFHATCVPIILFASFSYAEEDSELIEYNGKLYGKSAVEDVVFRCETLFGEKDEKNKFKSCIDKQLDGFLRQAEFKRIMKAHTYKKIHFSCSPRFTTVQENPFKGFDWASLAECYDENAEAMIQIDKRNRIYNRDLFEACYSLTDDYILWNDCEKEVLKNLGLTPVSSIEME